MDDDIKDRMRASYDKVTIRKEDNPKPAVAKKGIFGFLKPKTDDARSVVDFGKPGTGVPRSFGDGSSKP